jgi:myo-inositol-1(or 4)-monophosphatase
MKIDDLSLMRSAEAVARAAGEHALAHYGRRKEIFKSLAFDIKLVLDRECQDVAEREVARLHPGHAILGEEGRIDTGADITWIIDPIDGTLNFTHGLPHWAVSVAARDAAGVVRAGCVFLPMYGECFTAAIGEPARCNGQPVRVAAPTPLRRAMTLTGVRIPANPEEMDLGQAALLLRSSQITRMLGAAAVDLCWVACGKADAYVDQALYVWDLAAGRLLVEQAGGRFRAVEIDSRYDIIAASPDLFAELDALLPVEAGTPADRVSITPASC